LNIVFLISFNTLSIIVNVLKMEYVLLYFMDLVNFIWSSLSGTCICLSSPVVQIYIHRLRLVVVVTVKLLDPKLGPLNPSPRRGFPSQLTCWTCITKSPVNHNRRHVILLQVTYLFRICVQIVFSVVLHVKCDFGDKPKWLR